MYTSVYVCDRAHVFQLTVTPFGTMSFKPVDEMSAGERKEALKAFLKDMYHGRQKELYKWSRVTSQTPFVETKWLGQNIVSFITGVPGTLTAARGKDLSDGSEIKSCSRVGQMSRCGKCGTPVAPFHDACPKCGNRDIDRKTDSHWIFNVSSEPKKRKLLETNKIYLVLIDNEDAGSDPTKLARFRVWELRPKENALFREYVEDYYRTFYVARRQRGEEPAPMNLHPLNPKTNRLDMKLVFDAQMNLEGDVSIASFA